MIAIKHLKELHKINPDISAEDLIKLAEYYVEMSKSCVNEIKNCGDSVKIFYNGNVEIKDYKKGKNDEI